MSNQISENYNTACEAGSALNDIANTETSEAVKRKSKKIVGEIANLIELIVSDFDRQQVELLKSNRAS